MTVQLLDGGGKRVATATTQDNGQFVFKNVGAGTFKVGIDAATFAGSFGGVSWLGAKLITPAIIIAYTWVWAGFAMVVIAAGLAAIPRDVLEAARTDGATEWQVFRRVTAPLLAPFLSVVFITMIINVLKVFDIVLSIAPGASQDDGQRRRARDVADVVRRGQRLRPRIGHRRLPVPSRDPVLLLNVRRFKGRS